MSRPWRVGYYPTIGDGPVARFRVGPFGDEVSASRNGVAVRVALITDVTGLGTVLKAAERVHIMLHRAYESRPLSGPEDPKQTIQHALGDEWELESPAFGRTWPV